MCGICGVVGIEHERARAAVEAMCEAMFRRGPDDGGVAVVGHDSSLQVALGSRRLSIIDPSPAGHQPMRDQERSTWLVYNGMLYNFRELKHELEAAGERFVSNCDTEVVLRAYGVWGPDCIQRLHGMFALAIWDERRNELFLARDRLGIKPLYYRSDGQSFVFASTVRAIVASGLTELRLDERGIRSFLANGAVHEPLTAIEGVLALPAGHVASLKAGSLTLRRYWSPDDVPEIEVGESEATEQLATVLDAAVKRHLVSDAPLGVFLSGGLDSSIVSAVVSRHAPSVRTVTVIFDDPSLSEEPYADLLARRIDSEHITVRLGARELQDSLPRAFQAMDQPSFDGVNTYVASRAAAESGLKVALSGLGADELFDGYGHARRAARLEALKRLPEPAARLARRGSRLALSGARSMKLAAWLTPTYERGSSYELLRSLFLRDEVDALVRNDLARTNGHAPRQRLVVLELDGYLKNVLLRDTDAMSMGNSLEVRVPFLDDEVVRCALELPTALRMLRGKRLLAEAHAAVLPTEILRRPKHGFLLPLEGWLRRDLAAAVAEMLASPPPLVSAMLDPVAMTGVWQSLESGRSTWLRPWALYALCRWADTLRSSGSPPPFRA